MALESTKTVTSIYETNCGDDEDGISVIDRISTNVDEQNMITNKIAITQLIKGLKEQERQVILLRYYRGMTQTETAKILGTSQVQISRIEKRALKEMKRRLSEDVVMH